MNFQRPTENVDGSALTDLAGYRIYLGLASRAYSSTTTLADPTATSTGGIAFSLPADGNAYTAGEQLSVYAAMTAYDSAGNESAFSNEVVRTATVIDDVAPGAPIIITITITIDCPPGVSCVME